jgi:antitoxin ParD1/3/4
MPARNVNLTDHLARFVDASVESGRFQNASEVIREALRLLEERQREHELKLEALRQAIDLGLEDAAKGRTKTIETGEIRGYLRGLGRTARA